MQVTAYGRQTVPDRGVVRSCEPLQNFGGRIISPEQLNLKSSNLYTSRLYINSMQQDDISPTKGAWLWSRDCFKILPFVVMLRVARVCQRQMSYLLPARRSRCAATTSHDHVSVCLHVSVCVFVTRRYCIKKAKRRMTRTTPRDSPGTLVF